MIIYRYTVYRYSITDLMMQIELIAKADIQSILSIPLFLESVEAGFPSPAQDFIDRKLDLNELCIAHPSSTYFVRVAGWSMKDAGITPGDILIVDRSLTATHGNIVIAMICGELTVKELAKRPKTMLLPCNNEFKPIELAEGETLEIFGVVTFVIHRCPK